MDTSEFVLVVFCFILIILITLTFCKYNPYCHFNNYVVPYWEQDRGNDASNVGRQHASNVGRHHESKVGPHRDALNLGSNTVIQLSGITIEPSVPWIDDLFNRGEVGQLTICPVNEEVITESKYVC
jgi:hypothetical protein